VYRRKVKTTAFASCLGWRTATSWRVLLVTTASLLANLSVAQTPRETAPARPAPLPPARQPFQVVDLPAPPSADSPADLYATAMSQQAGREGAAYASGIGPQAVRGASLQVPTIPSGSPMEPRVPALDVSIPLPSFSNQQLPAILPTFGTPTPSPSGLFSAPLSLTAPPGESTGNFAAEPQYSVGEFKAGTLLAVVGTEHILAGDIHQLIAQRLSQRKGAQSLKDLAIPENLIRQALVSYVMTKAMYQEFFRDMVGNKSPKELADIQQQILTRAGKVFHEKFIPTYLKEYEAKDLKELEEKLREDNMSLVTLRTQFIEQVLAGQIEQKYVPEKFDVEPAQIMEYYRQHREKWEIPARARWRQVTVRFDKHPSRSEAEQLINRLGNEIFLGGKSFEAVARQSSEGYTADQGGLHDWTHQGSLKSRSLDMAIFSLKLGHLSQVIEDEIGFHIIEVLEREPQRSQPLAESQSEIREKLTAIKRDKASKELKERVMKRTLVWTRWPEDIPGSRPLSEALGNEFE
jgi:parvulin-like peptidyl-prolyl isomerase